MERKQVWWIDYNHEVKTGYQIAVRNDNVAIETGDGFAVVRCAELYESYVAACGEAAQRLMRQGTNSHTKAAALLTQLAKISENKGEQ